jgi:hypothetical protein
MPYSTNLFRRGRLLISSLKGEVKKKHKPLAGFFLASANRTLLRERRSVQSRPARLSRACVSKGLDQTPNPPFAIGEIAVEPRILEGLFRFGFVPWQVHGGISHPENPQQERLKWNKPPLPAGEKLGPSWSKTRANRPRFRVLPAEGQLNQRELAMGIEPTFELWNRSMR